MRSGTRIGGLAQYIVDSVESDGTLYRQQYRPIVENLAKKKAKGIYERDKAIKLVMYLAESGIKKFKRAFEEYNETRVGAVPASTKRAIAVELLAGMSSEIADEAREIKKKMMRK
jgi:hypothetical protein